MTSRRPSSSTRPRSRPRASRGRVAAADPGTGSPLTDELGEQLAGWGTVLRLETRGRTSGRVIGVAVGFVGEPDGSVLVAATAAGAGWARNLEADPRCRVTIGDASWAAQAEPLIGAEANRAVRELILRYGTPAERLGGGPVFRLRREGPPTG